MIKIGNTKDKVNIKYPSFSGEDGGYYIPSYNDEGYLEFTPTQPDMPAVNKFKVVGEKGDKGDAGESGVYIGDNPPTSANVWINPNGEPSYVMTAEQVKEYIDLALGEVENGTY